VDGDDRSRLRPDQSAGRVGVDQAAALVHVAQDRRRADVRQKR
jgi:hypothetical protein